VKDKLESLFDKYKNYGSLSNDLKNCLTSFTRNNDDEFKDKYSNLSIIIGVLEPLELDKTLQTLLNCSNALNLNKKPDEELKITTPNEMNIIQSFKPREGMEQENKKLNTIPRKSVE